MEDRRWQLAEYKLQKARDCLTDAQILFDAKRYDGAANRSYYAIFDAATAVLALEGVAFSKHQGVISYFQRNYVKTGIFGVQESKSLQNAFTVRQKADYTDFYVISKDEVERQIMNAQAFLNTVEAYIKEQIVEPPQ